MSSQNCFFHPDVQAVDKCERCNKLLCLKDKRTFNQSYGMSSTSSGSFSSYNYPMKYTLCPPCYFQVTESSYKSFKKISSFQKVFIGIFLLFFLIVAGAIFFVFSNLPSNLPIDFGPFVLIPIIFILLFFGLIVFFIYLASKSSKYADSGMQDVMRDKKEFYLEHGSKTEFSFSDIYCNQCGAKIQKSDSYCPNCGDSTRDELKSF